MEATVLPANATNAAVFWAVSSGLATINASGLLTATANGAVTVTASAMDGSGQSGSAIITLSNQTIGIQQHTVDRLGVFPNPSSGSIKFLSQTKISRIDITNTLGATVYSGDINAYQADIDLSNQPVGIYIYTLTDSEKIIGRGKIVLE